MVKLLKVKGHQMTSRKPDPQVKDQEVIECSCGAKCRHGIRCSAETTWRQHAGVE